MTALPMPMLPDCGICGGPVRSDLDGAGPVEECGWCGNRQRPISPKPDRAAIRTAARQVVSRARRDGLPPMRCPSCKRDRHDRCHAAGCECPTGEHPLRPTAAGLALLTAETPGHLDPTDLPEED